MAKDYKVSLLYDFYGNMLTDKQRDAIELYYNADLSLGEIADDLGISRQGVRDNIKRSEAILFDAEERLGLLDKWKKSEKALDDIIEHANNILSYSLKYSSSPEIEKNASDIIKIAKSLFD